MAISRVKTWVSLEVLYASDLNAEFNNIINNALSLVSPWTSNMNAGGFRLDGLADGTASVPGLGFNADSNTGIYRIATDEMAMTAGGSQALIAVLAGGTAYAKISGGISSGAAWQPGLAVLNDVDTGLMSITADTLDLVAGGRRIVQASAYITATNYLRITAAQATQPVQIDVAGGSTVGIYCATDFLPVAIATGQQARANALYQENVPKAWCHFDGTGTPKLHAQFNVSSITDRASGDFAINFNRVFLSTAYVAVGLTGLGTGTFPNAFGLMIQSSSAPKATTSFYVQTGSVGAGLEDMASSYLVFWGPQ